MEVLLLWFGLSVVAGMVASSKGRSGFGYFALSILLTPLIGLLLAGLLPRVEPVKPAPAPTSDIERRPCPYCAERIAKNARVCRFCNRELDHAETVPGA